MKGSELTVTITALANAIACALPTGELGLVASIFVQLGDTLATVAAERALSKEREERVCE